MGNLTLIGLTVLALAVNILLARGYYKHSRPYKLSTLIALVAIATCLAQLIMVCGIIQVGNTYYGERCRACDKKLGTTYTQIGRIKYHDECFYKVVRHVTSEPVGGVRRSTQNGWGEHMLIKDPSGWLYTVGHAVGGEEAWLTG